MIHYPLVSAIMPIADRQEYIAAALACFASQDWPHRELIVIDNGERECSEYFAGVPGVHYHRVSPGPKIGQLRNIACRLATGQYIAHWDSDDWYGPRRLTQQVTLLRQSERPATGYNILPFADDRIRRAWLYEGNQGYACGTSLMYLRAVWELQRFAEGPRYGEDNDFINRLKGRLISDSGNQIVARIHDGGTSPRDIGGWREIDYGQLLGFGYQSVEVTADGAMEGMAGHPEHAGWTHTDAPDSGSRDDGGNVVLSTKGRRYGGRKLRSSTGDSERQDSQRDLAANRH